MGGEKVTEKKVTNSKPTATKVNKDKNVDYKAHVIFFSPFFVRPYVYVTKKDKREINNVEDVSVYTGFSEDFIKKLIKREDMKLKMYKDSRGINTIGVGHNVDADPNYNLGDKITKKKAYELLAKDLLAKRKELRALISPTRLKQNQKEALMDLIFNTGVNKLQNTELIKKIKEGKFREACQDFDFILTDNKVSPGLCKRRIQNIYDFSKDDPSEESLEAMEKIQSKGLKVVKQNVKKAKTIRKLEMKMREALYKQETDYYIKKRKEEIKKK